MTVYTTVPLDDSNLDVTVTENADLVSIDINPASFTGSGGGGGGAVDSVNAKIGIVVLDTDDIGEGVNKYYTDAKVQTVIDTNTAGYASTTYVDTEDATTLSTANTYTDTSIAAIPAVDLSSYETIVNSNAGDATTLSSANTYTDTSIAAIPATDLSAYSTTVQVEALPVSTFTNDSGYSTTTYVDTNDATTLASANSYTDSRVLTDRGTGVTSTYVATVVVGGTTFNMPAVTGEIKSDQGYFELSYAGATGITVATLTAASTYVYLDNAGALQQQVTIPTRQDWSRKIFVMRIAVDLSNNTIIGFEYLNNPLGHYANSIRDVYEYLLAQGIPFKKDQLITGRAADLGFDVSAGTLLEFGGTGDINNANILDFTAVSNAGFFLTTRTAFDAGGNTDLPKFWDNGGTLTALGSTTVVGHRIYRFSNGNLCLQYGQGNYANINLAEAGVLLEDYVLNPILKNATFFGWWLLQETATNTGGTTLTKFVDYTIGVSGGSSSGLSGALLKGNNLSDLIDAATARTNLGIDLANLPVHVVSDTTTGTYAPPKMLNRSGDSAAFDFVTDDQTYAGAYSARLGLVSWANLASNNVAVASFKSTNDNQLFNLTATGSADDGSHDMDFKLRGATGYLSTRDNSSPGGALTDMTIEGTNLKLKSPIINFNDNFTFPNADGTVDQVMSTDGAGNLSWVTASGGGGGATALSDLTDVSELNLQNNDLLMYNSTASEWQNTNLGVSVTPTLTGDASTLKNQSYTFTVSNHDNYDNPTYVFGVYDSSSNQVLNNDDFTRISDDTFQFIPPNTSTGTVYDIKVKCQDFGSGQSVTTTKSLTLVQFGDSFRYWKLTGVTCANGNWWMLANMRLFDAASQSGTSYPGNMTSATTPSPYVIDTSNNYNATYPAWKALDANTTTSFYWTIGSSNGPADWITIDLGSTIDVKSMTITAGNSSSYAPKGFELYGSATGVFGGEETLVHTASNLPAVSGQVTNIG